MLTSLERLEEEGVGGGLCADGDEDCMGIDEYGGVGEAAERGVPAFILGDSAR